MAARWLARAASSASLTPLAMRSRMVAAASSSCVKASNLVSSSLAGLPASAGMLPARRPSVPWQLAQELAMRVTCSGVSVARAAEGGLAESSAPTTGTADPRNNQFMRGSVGIFGYNVSACYRLAGQTCKDASADSVSRMAYGAGFLLVLIIQ